MTPIVSVVVVSYRSLASLPDCLASLRECGAVIPLEVIVVDNASNDGVPEWLCRQHPDVILIANPDNRGFTRAVNQGLERARGTHLLVLNPDCVVAPEALQLLVQSLEGDPRAAAVGPMLLSRAHEPARSSGRFPDLWTLLCDHLGLARWFPRSPLFGRYKYGERGLAALDQVDWVSGAALLVSRAAYQKVGGLDENLFMYMEEVDWCRRAARAGFAVRFVPHARILHSGQESSRQVSDETYLHNLRSRIYYFRKHHGAVAAVIAKGILFASLLFKWSANVVVRAGTSGADVYARGMGVVWVA